MAVHHHRNNGPVIIVDRPDIHRPHAENRESGYVQRWIVEENRKRREKRIHLIAGFLGMLAGLIFYFGGGYLFISTYNKKYPWLNIVVNESLQRIFLMIGPIFFFVGLIIFIVSYASFCKGCSCDCWHMRKYVNDLWHLFKASTENDFDEAKTPAQSDFALWHLNVYYTCNYICISILYIIINNILPIVLAVLLLLDCAISNSSNAI